MQLCPNSVFNDNDDVPASDYFTTDELNVEIQKTPENIRLIHINAVSLCKHRIYHNQMPLAFQDYFQVITHPYNTRTRKNAGFVIPQPRTERGKRSLKYTGIEVWAAIPESLKHMSHKSFKYHLKAFVIENRGNTS